MTPTPETLTKDAICSSCHQSLHLFMSQGMDSEGNRFQTPMYSPCLTCLRHEHMRGMVTGIEAVLEREEK